MKVVEDSQPEIKKGDVFRLVGQKGRRVSKRLSRQIDMCITSISKEIRPRVVYTGKKIIDINKGILSLEGGVELKSARLSKSLRGCKKVTVFLATIGEGIDEFINKSMSENKPSEAFIYDAIGSAAIEAAVEKFQNSFDSDLTSESENTTLRFSPGYCDWSISDQMRLFNVLENDLINVRLNENCLMTPRKSVSGVFGIGDSVVVDKNTANPCRMCNLKKCIARRN